MDGQRTRGERMKQKRIAYWVWRYHNEHGMPQDDLRNWVWSSEFIRTWQEEVTSARIYENREKIKTLDRIDTKQLLWVWLDCIKYGYTGNEPIKPLTWWERFKKWLF